jgi:hypothetical protein
MRMRMDQIQSVAADAAAMPEEYVATVSAYLEKIRALGASVLVVHDEYIIDYHGKEEIVGDVNSLLSELVNYQLTQYIRSAAKYGPINLPVAASIFEKEWKDFADNAFDTTLKNLAPRLTAAMREAKARKVRAELDYKKIYKALQIGGHEWADLNEPVRQQIKEAEKHLLEVYPDADK